MRALRNMGKPQNTVEGPAFALGREREAMGREAKYGMNKESFPTWGLAALQVCIEPSESQAALPARSK